MIPIDRPTRVAGSLLALFFVVACSGETSEKKEIDPLGPIAPRILRFQASPSAILPGEATTLEWSTQGAISLLVSDDEGRPVHVEEQDTARGYVSVSPTETTAYTLTASGATGALGPALRTVTVEVSPEDTAPTIETFTASAEAISIGGEVTLSWRTSHAAALTLKDDAGVEISLGDSSPANGSVGVRPTRSTTVYTLIASSGIRRATAVVRVTVDGLPRVHRFSVDPVHPVTAGTFVQLGWETSRADRVVIEDRAGAVVVDTASPSGTHSRAVDQTTEFRLTATRNGVAATAVVHAQVGAEIGEFTASPRVARVGDPIILAWKTAGADSVILTGPGNFNHTATGADVAAGAIEHALAARGDYTLHARLGDVVRTSTVFVESTEAPRIRSLVPDRSILTAAADHPGKVTLSYVQDGGATCTLYRNGVAVPGKTGFTCPRTGTVETEVDGTSDLRLVAVNNAGDHRATIHVIAVDPARIPVFTNSPARRLAPGDSVTMNWKVTDAVRVRMKQGDTTVAIGETQFVGTRAIPVNADTVFTLFAENSLGDVTRIERPVLAGRPEIAEFKVKPRVAAPLDTLVFTWTCDGGDTLKLGDEGGVLTTVTEPALIDSGSFSITGPAAPDPLQRYTMTVENRAGQSSAETLDLVVTDGPLVRSLTASRSEIALGSTVDITWVVSDDFGGNTPTLVLTDTSGDSSIPYDLTGNTGTVTIRPDSEGRHEFTLKATTNGTRPSETDVDPVVVEVTVAAEIVSFTADPSSAFTTGGTVTPTSRLEWETEDAVDLWIFEATATGDAIPPALLRLSLADGASQQALDSGGLDVQPLATAHYLLRVANRIGATVQKTVRILVDPPVIESFEPDVVDLIAGEGTTLRWTTENAVTATVQPMSVTVKALEADPTRFVDIEGMPGAQPLTTLNTLNTLQTITFPEGFRFPFDDRFFDGVRATSNGFLSFDLSTTTASNLNQRLPTDGTYRYAHLAVLWDALSGNNAGVTGKAYWRFDEVERTITIMWKDWSFNAPSVEFHINFEVILYENGSFEYRYGEFSTTSTNATYIGYTKGSGATIGFQDLTGTIANTIYHNTALPNGPNHLAWHFEVDAPLVGDRQVTPSSSRSYKLIVANADAITSKDTQVNVWPIPAITFGTIFPASPTIDVPFTVSWETSRASRIRLVDELGKVLCEELDAGAVAKGSCKLTADTAGTRNWQFQAINGIDRNLVIRPLVFSVSSPLSIDAFSVSKTFVASGETIQVTWEGHGGYEAELYECVPHTNRSACTPIDIGSQDPNDGSYETTITRSKEYYFRLLDRGPRATETWANVWVDIPVIDDFTAPVKTIAGGNTTLSWSTTGDWVTLTGFDSKIPDYRVITDEFIDISETGTPITMTGHGTAAPTATAGNYILNFEDLPEYFAFPYLGTRMTALIAKTDGFISFDTTYTDTNQSNASLPSTSHPKVHLAPFWNDLKAGTSSKFQWKLETSPHGIKFLILQWTAFEFNAYAANLNFQVLLWENGEVDFRYGTMTSSAYPAYAKGSRATLAIHGKNGTWAQQLSYNSAWPDPQGLNNRSFRFSLAPLASGQTVVNPTVTTTYRLCVNNQSLYEVCEERQVLVIQPGSLLFSEIMIAPTTPRGEWIEIRNLSSDPIDLAGFTLTSGSGGVKSFTIPGAPPVILEPNAFAILAPSASSSDNGGVSPRVVYGDAIDLDNTADSVALVLGTTTMDRLEWTTGWTIPANKSLQLEPSKFVRAETANDSPANWCVSPAEYGGGFFGSPGELGTGCFTGNQHDYYVLDPFSGMPWIDIAGTGTVLPDIWASPHYEKNPIQLGFKFPYFEDEVEEMVVFKFGAIGLGPPLSNNLLAGAGNVALPGTTTNTPNGLVAPLWDTIHPNGSQSQKIRYEARNVGGVLVMVIQWNDVSLVTQNGSNLSTFQAQLWETGDIAFVYKEPTIVSSTNASYAYGSCATIAIQNLARDLAYPVVEYTTCSTSDRPAYGGRSYRFIPR